VAQGDPLGCAGAGGADGAGGQALLVATYIALAFLGYTIIMLPLSWWSAFVLPHRYGQSTQNRSGWATDEVKTTCLSLALAGFVGMLIYWLLGHLDDRWWIWASALLIVLASLWTSFSPSCSFRSSTS